MSFKTPDLCDDFENDASADLRIVEPLFRAYGGRAAFSGQIVTLKLFEDNSLVREALGQDGRGKVLVVDGGGSLRCALVGDLLAALAVKNGWAGIVVNGCIRDTPDMAAMALGLRALNTHPKKSVKKGIGDRDLPVTFAGVTFTPDQWLYADPDGIVVAAKALV